MWRHSGGLYFAGSVGLEVAAGRHGQAVGGDQSGLYKIDDWMPCPQLPGLSHRSLVGMGRRQEAGKIAMIAWDKVLCSLNCKG